MKTKKITLKELNSIVKKTINEMTLSHGTDEDPIDDYYDDGEDFYVEDYVKYDDNFDVIVSDFNKKIKNEMRKIIINTEYKITNPKEDAEFLEQLYSKVLKPLKPYMSEIGFLNYVDIMVEQKLKGKLKKSIHY